MHLSSGTVFLASLSSIVSYVTATPVAGTAKGLAKPPAFFLAGDSTTATQAGNGGGKSRPSTGYHTTTNNVTGWGNGFLDTTLKNDATGTNYGHNGATTVSFRSGGDWDTVMSAAKSVKSSHSAYVTIQFGHNDQKPEKEISMAQFTANLIKFVDEVRAIPATPILVTSLSRRRFSTSTGKINENLKDVVAATKEAARKTGASIIDLNTASTQYLNAIGEDRAATYNLKATDFTHLNSQGSVVFGNMVAMLLGDSVPEVKEYVVPVAKIAKALKAGEYYFP
jgi:lysophospholipase L1-like esterase